MWYNVDTVITTKKDVTFDEVAAKLEKYNDVDKDRLEKAKHDIDEYLKITIRETRQSEIVKTLQAIIAFYNGLDKKCKTEWILSRISPDFGFFLWA